MFSIEYFERRFFLLTQHSVSAMARLTALVLERPHRPFASHRRLHVTPTFAPAPSIATLFDRFSVLLAGALGRRVQLRFAAFGHCVGVGVGVATQSCEKRHALVDHSRVFPMIGLTRTTVFCLLVYGNLVRRFIVCGIWTMADAHRSWYLPLTGMVCDTRGLA